MKKTALGLTLMLLFSSVIGVQLVSKAKAEIFGPIFFLDFKGNEVKISYPQNQTYNADSILVNFTIEMGGYCFDFGYNIDGGPIARIATIEKVSESGWIPYVTYVFSGSVLLANLSEGSHSIAVYHGYQETEMNKEYEVFSYDYVNFTIDTLAPNILIYSPENAVYNVTNVSLNFTVDEPVSQVTYSLDGQSDVLMNGNTMLTNLTYGEHNITLYATDLVGNIGISDTMFFDIAAPSQPIPTMSIIASLTIVTVTVALGFVVYLKRFHRDNSQ
jgi:hypothetical protein